MGAELERIQPRGALATGERVASRVQGHTLLAIREATRELCGEAWLAEMTSRLPSRVFARLAEKPDWVPAEYVTAWAEAAWEGPLAQDPRALARCVDRMLDHGFGKSRRMLLAIATPQGIVRRAAELWRAELSDGRVVAYGTSPTSARITLHDHPFLESTLLRDSVAEAFRYALTLAGAKDAVELHTGEVGEPLVVSISWRS